MNMTAALPTTRPPYIGAAANDEDWASYRAAGALRYCLDNVLGSQAPTAAPATISQALEQAMVTTLDACHLLAKAIRSGDFELARQPVVSLADGEVRYYEVLLRFNPGESPQAAIRLAEETGLIKELDYAVVRRAIRRLREEPAEILAVNLSGHSVADPAFIERLCDLIQDCPDIHGRLMFELTESAGLKDLRAANRHIQALRALGCRVSLDDFGAGAASLAYLQNLSVDVVKIDGGYIRGLQPNSREATMLSHLVSMCAGLGVQTVAEMVETQEVEEVVRAAGVNMGQGWLYGAPAVAGASLFDGPDYSAAKARAH